MCLFSLFHSVGVFNGIQWYEEKPDNESENVCMLITGWRKVCIIQPLKWKIYVSHVSPSYGKVMTCR